MGNLRDLTQPCPRPAHQPFQDYEPGFLHIDVTYLPQMPGESQRRSLFVAIDRATRWVFMQIKPTKSARSTRAFLTALVRACPLRIRTLLTVNGKEFTDRFVTCAEHTPTGQHALDALCAALSLEPCLTRPPPTPDQRDGRALQRSHQRGVARAALHQGGEDLQRTLQRYVWLDHQQLPQSALGGRTAMEAMKQWFKNKPDLFHKKPIPHPGRDT